nr:hypothetical protein HmN_000687000 [Hymenolepis microstoma]
MFYRMLYPSSPIGVRGGTLPSNNTFYSSLGNVFVNQGSLTFLDAFSFCLNTTDKAIFTSICVILAGTGIISNLCIITANVLYRVRFQRESDFYTSGERTRRTTKRFSINPFKVDITQENRFSYFDALSSQAKFRYSHVVFAIAVFNLLASLFLIPLTVVTICDWSPSVMAENYFIIICAAWSVFQILFMSSFFFVNTTIQFLSIVHLWSTIFFDAFGDIQPAHLLGLQFTERGEQ